MQLPDAGMDVWQLDTAVVMGKRGAATYALNVTALLLLLVTVIVCAALTLLASMRPKSSGAVALTGGLMVSTGITWALMVAACGLAVALLLTLMPPFVAPRLGALNCTMTVQLVLAAKAPPVLLAGHVPPAVPLSRL